MVKNVPNIGFFFFILFILHPYCYIRNTGLVQLCITKLQYTYKVSKL